MKSTQAKMHNPLSSSAKAAPEALVVDWLADIARIYPQQASLIDLVTGRRFVYHQTFDRVCRLAAVFRSQGCTRGDRVMALVRNSTDVYEMMFACWRIGAVFMPVNWRLAPAELAAIHSDGDPALLIVDDEFAANLDSSGKPRLSRSPGSATSSYERALAAALPDRSFAAIDLDAMNMLMYTSGTTGKPKGVIGNWRMTTTMLLQAATNARLGPGCVTLTAAPLFHTAGLNSFATPTLHVGGAIAVMDNWQPGACLAHLRDPDLKITHTLGVPTQFLAMSRHADFANGGFPFLRVAAVGGAPPTEELMRTWAEKGHALMPGYGMTEAFGVANMEPELAMRKPGAVGRAMAMTRLRIADEQGLELPAGERGEIQLAGPGITPGYWRQPELTQAAFVDGWFRTGDIGFMDSDGICFLVDRKKDMFISGGENVYPAEVENLLADFPEISQVAVIGIKDPVWGEVGKAIVVLRPGAAVDAAELLGRCRGRIAAYKIPKAMLILPSLPLSAQGKVMKNELRKLYGG